MPTVVSDATQLRTAIQAAVLGEEIQLNTLTPSSLTYSTVTTLAKFPCFTPLTRTGGYIINGISRSTTLTDTRIYQENIDGPYAPSEIKNLTLNYNSGNTAIFRASMGSYNLDNLNITGNHSGWAGNGSVYMSLNASPTFSTSNVNFTLTNSTISITGQAQTAAFLQSWNNTGTINIGTTSNGNIFNESGYNRGSIHLASMYTGGIQGPMRGTYQVRSNVFTGNGTTRSNSNRLENVDVQVNSNIFEAGSYLDVAGTLNMTRIVNNTFKTIAGGPGVRFTQKSSSLATIVTPMNNFSNNMFEGYGLAIINNDIDPVTNNPIATPTVVTQSGANMVKAGTLATGEYEVFTAGGSYGDTITRNGLTDWISGGEGADTIDAAGGADMIIGGNGNDTITTGIGADRILYYNPSEGMDTITDFVATGATADTLAFRSSAFGNIGTGTLPGANFSTNPGDSTTVPTFLYNGNVLTYDADGLNNGVAGVTIATFSPTSPTLTASNIQLF
jgi:hypothetical protein